MKSSLKVLLLTIGTAALLAAPAMAGSSGRHHSAVHHRAAPVGVYVPNNAYGYTYGYKGQSQETSSERWCATHPSWDACHDPRENPQQ
jgi:hypothetical protein